MGAFRIFSRFSQLLDIKVTRAAKAWLRLNEDGSVTERTAAETLSDLGGGTADVGASIHAAAAVTTLVGTEEVGHVTADTLALKKIVWNNIKTWILDGITSFPGFGTNHTTAAYGDHAHSGTYDPAGSAAAVMVKTRMVVSNAFDHNEVAVPIDDLLYDGIVDGKAAFRAASQITSSQVAQWSSASGGFWQLYKGSVEWRSPQNVPTPDLVTLWNPYSNASTENLPIVTAQSNLIDVPPNAAQPAATPSVRALGTGALEALPGNTAVVLSDAAYANLKSLSILASTY